MTAFLSKLWSEGLISKEAFTHDYSQSQSLARGVDGTAIVGFSWGWSAADRFGAELADQYVSMPQLKARADQSEKVTWQLSKDALQVMPNKISVSAKAANKDAALKIVNAFYDIDISMQATFGDYGIDLKKTGDKSFEVLPPADPTKDSSTWNWTETLNENASGWTRGDLTEPAESMAVADQDAALSEAYANQDPETDKWPYEIKMSEDDLKTLSLNNTTILNTAMSKFSSWVTKGGIESEWNDTVAALKKANIDNNTAIYQKYYDEYKQR